MTQPSSVGRAVRRLGRRVLPDRLLYDVRRRRRLEPWVREPWRRTRPDELRDGVDIWQLISPLRYDVLLRRDFLASLANDAPDPGDATFVEAVRASTYHTWFVASEIVRTGLAAQDAAAIEAAFEVRVRRVVALFRRLESADGELDQPIVLKTATMILPPTTDRLGPPTGKVTSARYFVADGCHRLAYLLLRGRDRLRPDEFEVRAYPRFSPFDSTSLLMPAVRPTESDYVGFLSRGYRAPESLTTVDGLLAYVDSQHPDLIDEVTSVVRVDGFWPGAR